jgi:hypothetical protein
MIIGISGYAGSGKDTAAAIIKRIDNTWEVRKFAHKLKVVAEILTGIPCEDLNRQDVKESNLPDMWDVWGYKGRNDGDAVFPVYTGEPYRRSMTAREFLQKLGTDAIRNGLHEDAWVNALMSEYNSQCKWIITDVRFPNEYDAICRAGGVMVRINRGSPVNNHPSETALDRYEYQYVIDNNGSMAEFEEKVEYFYDNILTDWVVGQSIVRLKW